KEYAFYELAFPMWTEAHIFVTDDDLLKISDQAGCQLFAPFIQRLRLEGPLRFGFNSMHVEIQELPFSIKINQSVEQPKNSQYENHKVIPTAYEYILDVIDAIWLSIETDNISHVALIEQLCILEKKFAAELAETLTHILGMRFNFANDKFNTRISETIYVLKGKSNSNFLPVHKKLKFPEWFAPNITHSDLNGLYQDLKLLMQPISEQVINEISEASLFLQSKLQNGEVHPIPAKDWFRRTAHLGDERLVTLDPDPVKVASYLKSKLQNLPNGLIPFGICSNFYRKKRHDGVVRNFVYNNTENIVSLFLKFQPDRHCLLKIVTEMIWVFAISTCPNDTDANSYCEQLAKVVTVTAFQSSLTIANCNEVSLWNKLWWKIITHRRCFL
ncbi:hypothetical protein HK096_001015, partial [Nowakowskiella sp. JEL0078]